MASASAVTISEVNFRFTLSPLRAFSSFHARPGYRERLYNSVQIMRLLWILGFTVAIASADDLPRQALEILSTNCIGCHNGELKIAQLDLTTREGMLKGGERGEALSPGDPLKSRLYRAAAHLDQPSMPPGKKLQDWQVEVIKRWIATGAPMPAKIQAPNPKS